MDVNETSPGAAASWSLGAEFFVGADRESAILSEFGWEIRTDHHQPRGLRDQDQIEIDELENHRMVALLAGNLFAPEIQCSGGTGPGGDGGFAVADASTAIPSFSSGSSEDPPASKSAAVDPAEIPSKVVKKKGKKQIRQARFAFVTKNEVDHLEDGYRWRKYGQKAVKNSPFPRSYYRCTNSKCTVKKRVERSSEDPTTVVTTYEGQHCHQTGGFPRGGIMIGTHEAATFAAGHLNPAAISRFNINHPGEGARAPQVSSPSSAMQLQNAMMNQGLLGDIVPGATKLRS